MKLYYDKKSKDPTYFIQMGIRNGNKTTTKNVKKIGRHSELLSIDPDPLTYAIKQVQKYNDNFRENKVNISLNIDFDEKLSATDDIASKSTLLNVGYFVLQKIYYDLKIPAFFADTKNHSRVTFDCDGINRFLMYARVLEPDSILGTYDNLETYYEQPSYSYQHMLRFMDVLENNFDAYLEHLFVNSEYVVKRDTSVCYFDCTNYYFEIETEDPDYIDEVTGETTKAFRKYSLSKDHKPNPLVQMGLFMDGNGIPISMCVNPGSDNEQKCAVPLEQKITKMFKGKRFIYCADAGLGSLNIRKYNSMGGRAFIVTQSVKKLSQVVQQAVFSDIDYLKLSDDSPMALNYMHTFDKCDEKNLSLYNDVIYKILEVNSAVDLGLYEDKILKNGRTIQVKSKGIIKQKIIITFSRKAMEYQRHIRNAQIERARNIIKFGVIDDVKKSPHDVNRFIKRRSVTKDGELADDYYEIDQSAIENEEKYDGFYAVATNLDSSVKEILGINSKRYMIEDCFRVLKTNFRARPVYHRKKDRIIAHFMVCYTALLIYRLLERKLDLYGNHFTTDNIVETLKNMNVMNVQDLFYAATYKASHVCTALNGIYGLGLDKKYYQPKELNKKIKKISR